MDDVWRLTRLRHNLPGFRLCLSGWLNNSTRRRNDGARCGGGGGSGCSCCSRWTHHYCGSRRRRSIGELGLALRFLLAGQDCLHYIAGFGDVGEIDFRLVFLLSTGTGRTCPRWPGTTLKVSTNALSLSCFNGA